MTPPSPSTRKMNDTRISIGKMAVLPLTGRDIPIIADDFVDASFRDRSCEGDSCPRPERLLDRSTAQSSADQRSSMSRPGRTRPSRNRTAISTATKRGKRVVADLETGGFLAKIEDHTPTTIGQCYRCDTVIEPYLSDQWFVKMKPLAEPALRVVQDGTVRFYPEPLDEGV